jgi:restriction system protein
MPVWIVRAGSHGEREDFALEHKLACVGWDEVPDLSKMDTRDAVAALLRQVYPDDGASRVQTQAAQLHAFANRIAKDDLVVLPLKTRSQVAIGRVTGAYKYRPELGLGAMHTRPVEWRRVDVPRTAFAQDLLYSLGAFLTVCQVTRNDAEARIRAVLNGEPDPGFDVEPAIDNEDEVVVERNIEEDAENEILQYVIRQYKGHGMARLVDAVLQAEGYTTRLSPAGPDGGADILAGRGGLGLDGPRLCVQVKSSESPADVRVLRELQGSMQTFKADQGLLVCWGGLNGPAEREARHSFFSVRV